MFRIFAVFILVAVSAGVEGAGGEFASANRKYFVELSRAPEGKILVAVFHVVKEVKTLHWSRAVEWEHEDHGWNSPSVYGVKALVTKNGETVVLRDDGTAADKNGVRIVRRAPKEDRMVRPFQRRELSASVAEEHSSGLMRRQVSYLHVGALLDFILDDENSYALWFGQTDQWLLISFDNVQETVVKDDGKLRVLNEIGRAKARELVLQHQPPPLRKILGALKEKVAKYVPAIGRSSARGYMDGETTAAYLFLAARRFSADRSLIEGLVNFPADRIQHDHAGIHRELRMSFSVTRSERLIGDFLASRWNGETNREFIAKEMYLLLPMDTFRSLGSIKIDLEFPFPISSTNAGALWAYIIPAAVSPASWEEADELLSFSHLLSPHGLGRETILGPDGKAVIHGLTPGDYRAKFVWERNRPAGTWRTNVYVGIAGDYESDQTQTISVKAGETIEGISLGITNRIGGSNSLGN